MRKLILLLFPFTLFSIKSYSQVGVDYTFTQTVGTYNQITGGTLLTTNPNNQVFGPISIPTIRFNAFDYNEIFISSNGFITFGSAPAANNVIPISSSQTYLGAISAFGVRLIAAETGTPEIRHQLVGNEFVIQWTDVRREGTVPVPNERISFQIRLNTTNNQVRVVYGGPIVQGNAAGVQNPQVGLRGQSNSFANNDVNNRFVPANGNWAVSAPGVDNSSTCFFNSTAAPSFPSGLTYTWTPPASANYTGIINVGNGQTFESLSNTGGLFQALNWGRQTGNIIVNITSSLSETGFVGLNEVQELPAGSNFTILIRPSAAVERVIAGTFSGGLIRLSGADRVTIDGRFNGSGRFLRFLNSSSTGHSIEFLNSSQNNQLLHIKAHGQNNSFTGGVIRFSEANHPFPAGGNSFNVISNCEIYNTNLGNNPAVCIVSLGTNNAARNNNNNQIINNLIYNFTTSGVFVSTTGNGGNWNISNNNFYNTITNSGNQVVINFEPGTPSNANIINGNIIGGTEPNASGERWVNNGGTFQAIRAICGTDAATVINGNQIRNINKGGNFAVNMLNIGGGNYIIGDTIGNLGNIIGSQTLDSAIVFTGNAEFNAINLGNNTSITRSNIIANIIHTSNGNLGSLTGIIVSNTNFNGTISNNRIYKLRSNSTRTNFPTVNGIASIVSPTNIQVLNNRVFGLEAINTGTTAVQVNGIHITANNSQNHRCEGNIINGLNSLSSNPGTIVAGIRIAGGRPSVINNVVRLGVDTAGLSIFDSKTFIGIFKTSTEAANVWHNTVLIAGFDAVGSATTMAYRKNTDAAIDDVRNNIFSNQRSNAASGTSINLSYSTNSTNNLVSNFNLIHNPGVGGAAVGLGSIDSPTVFPSLSDWVIANQTLESGSIIANPLFSNPFGTNANFNLNILITSPASGAGINIPQVPTDILGNIRQNIPTLGAYESAAAVSDTVPPTIFLAPIGNTCLVTNPILDEFAAITDLGGVNTAIGLRPRIYYKRTTDANTFISNTSASNGWKFTEATNTTSPFSFIIDYSLLQGGAVQPGQTIQYFVIAQDLATSPNVGANGATFATQASSVNLTAAQFPVSNIIYSYQITLPDTAIIFTTSAPVCVGGSSQIQVQMNGGAPDWTIVYTNGTENFTTTSSNPTITITVQPNQTTTYQLVSVADSNQCMLFSQGIAQVVINQLSVGGTAIPTGLVDFCEDSNQGGVTLTGNTGNAVLWQFNNGSGWQDIPNSNNNVYNFSNLTTTTLYRALVQNGTCPPVFSDETSINISQLSFGGEIIPGDFAVCILDGSGQLNLTNQVGSIVKWQFKETGDWIDINNVTSTLNFSGLQNTRQYRVWVQNGVCPVSFSDSITVQVDLESVGGTLFGSDTVCFGNNNGFITLSGQFGNVVSWEYGQFGNWYNVFGADTFLQYFNLVTTTNFRVGVKNGVCPTVYSSVATLIVENAYANITEVADISTNNEFTLSVQGFATVGSIVTWDFGNGQSITLPPSNQSLVNAVHSYPTPGTYTIKLTASLGGCDAVDSIRVRVGPTGLEFLVGDDVKIYPNPSSDMVWFELPANVKVNRIRLINSTGKAVKDFQIFGEKPSINLQDLKPGLYFVQIHTNFGGVFRKLIKI